MPLNFEHDEYLKAHIKMHKSLGIKNSRINCELFGKHGVEDHAAELIRMNNRAYLVLYFSNEGKLKLQAISDEPEK